MIIDQIKMKFRKIFISMINESNFKFNKFFRKITKNKKKTLKILEIKDVNYNRKFL